MREIEETALFSDGRFTIQRSTFRSARGAPYPNLISQDAQMTLDSSIVLGGGTAVQAQNYLGAPAVKGVTATISSLGLLVGGALSVVVLIVAVRFHW